MPIERDDFEKGRAISEAEKAVLWFLEQNKDKAFTQTEISTALGFAKGQNFFTDLASYLSLGTMLENLVREGRIAKRIVVTEGRSETYYASKAEGGWSS